MTIHVPLTISHDSRTAFTLECQGQKLVHFKETGRLARLANVDPGTFARTDLLRWAAPFALAPQGLVCLHAAAAHKEGITIGVLGIGGAGKSTLVCELSRRGWQPIADDLMVCDAEGRVNVLAERVLRQWCDDEAARNDAWSCIDYSVLARQLADSQNQNWLPINGLGFLEPRSQAQHGKGALRPGLRKKAANFALRHLSSGDHFRRLVKYGFGGLPMPAAWANQFQVYGTLAGRVPGAILQVPRGLDNMRSALPQLEESLSKWVKDRAVVRV
jgi:hypothetical protein